MTDPLFPEPKKNGKRAAAKDTDDSGQPLVVPKDEPEALIRRFYTGGLPREEFEARMKAIGASIDDLQVEKQRIINPDPEQPGADAAKKYPGASHRL